MGLLTKKNRIGVKMAMELLLKKIEALRLKMIQEAELHGCFTHEKVVAISQQLDEYIVRYYVMK
ncbi:aspartyl-phosphate phosphatase Spo0E family protein [Paenibacillus sp. GCM10023248]